MKKNIWLIVSAIAVITLLPLSSSTGTDLFYCLVADRWRDSGIYWSEGA